MLRHTALRLTAIAVVAVGVALATHGCGDDESNPTGPPGGGTPADVTISIVGVAGANSYSPNPDTVTVGQTVAWKNNDAMTHTATDDGLTWNTGNIGPGATSAAITMSTAGSYAYHCGLHPTTMTGTLVVKP